MCTIGIGTGLYYKFLLGWCVDFFGLVGFTFLLADFFVFGCSFSVYFQSAFRVFFLCLYILPVYSSKKKKWLKHFRKFLDKGKLEKRLNATF